MGGGAPSQPGSRPTDTGQVVVLDDCPATNRLGLQGSKEILGGLLGCDAPPVASLIAPRLVDLTALEAPLKPTQLDEGEVLDQLQRRPSWRQPATASLVLTETPVLAMICARK